MNILKSGIHDALDSKKPILIVYERNKIRIDMEEGGVDIPYFAYSIVGKGG